MSAQEKVKVVFAGRYNRSEILSGPEKVGKRIFNEYTKHAPSVFIEYFLTAVNTVPGKKLFGREVIEENSKSKIIRTGLFRLLPLLFSYRPHIIHIITYERFAAVLLLYKLFSKVKIIYNAHGIIAYENHYQRKVSFLYKLEDRISEFLYLRYSDKIVFYSESSINLAEKYFKINESKIVILSSGIDKIFNNIYHHRNNSDNAELRIVLMSDLRFINKGLSVLKEIIGLIRHPVEINLIGNVISNSLNNGNGLVHIRFIKKMDTLQLAEFYRDKDVYLSLKDYETFSIAAVEAMASGLVPIVSKETGMSRYILEGENGYALGEVTAPSIAGHLNLLAENQQLRLTLSRNSAKIYEFLSWEDVFDTFGSIYSELTQN